MEERVACIFLFSFLFSGGFCFQTPLRLDQNAVARFLGAYFLCDYVGGNSCIEKPDFIVWLSDIIFTLFISFVTY